MFYMFLDGQLVKLAFAARAFHHNREFAFFDYLGHTSERTARDGLEHFSHFAAYRALARAERFVQKLEIGVYIVHRAVKHERARHTDVRLDETRTIKLFFGQKSEHRKRARRKSRKHDGVYRRARAAHNRKIRAALYRKIDKHMPGIGHCGHARVGHHGNIASRLELLQKSVGGFALVEFVIRYERSFYIVLFQQYGGMPSVLGGDEIDGLEHVERSQTYFVEIAYRRCNKIQHGQNSSVVTVSPLLPPFTHLSMNVLPLTFTINFFGVSPSARHSHKTSSSRPAV